MNISKLNQLFDDGTLSDMYKAGFISSKIFEAREIYLWVDAQMRSRKISKQKAVLEAEVKFNRGRSTIYAAIKKFELE